MSRISDAFAGRRALIAFLTAGDPSLNATESYVAALETAGVDLIELGIPFSDPIAEGPVIQEANIRALKAGTTVDDCLALAARLRSRTKLPLVFMSYLNPVFNYGYQRFFAACQSAGVDGIIIVDLPFEEKNEVKPHASAYGVELISMIAPTSAERTEAIAREAGGFIYLVSSLGVTGLRSELHGDLASIVAQIRSVSKLPIAVGFGIHSPEQVRSLADLSDGVIIGSALVSLVAASPATVAHDLAEFMAPLRQALDSYRQDGN